MAQGPTIINAMIIPLSAASAPPRPQPGPIPPKPPSGGRPDHTLPGDLPRPEHPIWYPLPPGVPPPPYIDNTLPGDQPRPDQGLPPVQGRPDQGLPGAPPRPDQGLPGSQPRPEHPIVLPPGGGNWNPIYIWGPTDPRPTPPIELPPEGETDDGRKIEFVCGWTPQTGWVAVAVVVPEHAPTPSKRK